MFPRIKAVHHPGDYRLELTFTAGTVPPVMFLL
jgi:hypothetical protein